MKNIKIDFIDVTDKSVDSLLKLASFSEEEIKEFDRYKNELGKKENIASTFLKKKYIKDIYLNEHGKPLSKDIFFNISHSKGLVVIAISNDSNIGVDVERIRDFDAKMIDYISFKEEKAFIKDNKSFYKIWTNKESLVKCVGTGLTIEIKDIPALPVNGVRHFNNKDYFTSSFELLDAIISVTLEGDSPFEIIK